MSNSQNDEIFEQVNKLLEARKRICELIEYKDGGDGVVGRLGEHIGAKAFQLKRARPGQEGYDAVDSNGLKYEIKARTGASRPTPSPVRRGRRGTGRGTGAPSCGKSVSFEIEQNAVNTNLFDFFLAIALDQDYSVTEAYKAPWKFLYEVAQEKKPRDDGRYSFGMSLFRDSKECENVTDKIRQSWPR